MEFNDAQFLALVNLIKKMRKTPELFALKLLEHDALRKDFVEMIENNPQLKSMSLSSEETNIWDLKKLNYFYDQFFKTWYSCELQEKNVEKSIPEVIIQQLHQAIQDENYELAEKIHKYLELSWPETLNNI